MSNQDNFKKSGFIRPNKRGLYDLVLVDEKGKEAVFGEVRRSDLVAIAHHVVQSINVYKYVDDEVSP
jgi:hypothetical protein